MERVQEVQWYKECYPLPDECGKKVFATRREAVWFGWKMSKEGYQIMSFERDRDEDEDVT